MTNVLHRRPIIIGVLFVLIGGLFTADKMFEAFSVGWSHVLLVIGVALAVEAFHGKRRALVFPSTFLFLLGAFLLAQQEGWLDEKVWYSYIIMAIGITFIVVYLTRAVTDSGFVISGLLFIAVGALFAFQLQDDVLSWWPLWMIVFGLVLVFIRR